MERAIGDKFDYKDAVLEVEKIKNVDSKHSCTGCYFLEGVECTVNDIDTHNIVGDCTCRNDSNFVIFKQVDNKPKYPFYRVSNAKRKYSTTPIVRVFLDGNGKEQEEIEICVVLPKKSGDALSEKIVELLNKSNVR